MVETEEDGALAARIFKDFRNILAKPLYVFSSLIQ